MPEQYIKERIDKLTLFYLEKTVDISKLTVEEFIDKFNKIQTEIYTCLIK
ncbi:hypothetical protein LY28_00044 [Ruminiclostridium sufflavum DSM 19573]|uniref:Uncharacterized protein n=1 Tax=Ruminiclostridium sufflavum DSM 19573 TaxID=1121337 RepID=A0A318XRP6_9FIRM|nr:hypothetical protein LY28_00044 [Ruminiclostridium sufflavum DSM 19573]